jgi:hypothetical protein
MDKGISDNIYSKYRNPDPRCGYPFTPEPLDYCWSWANRVDRHKTANCDGCKGCDMFRVPVADSRDVLETKTSRNNAALRRNENANVECE